MDYSEWLSKSHMVSKQDLRHLSDLGQDVLVQSSEGLSHSSHSDKDAMLILKK